MLRNHSIFRSIIGLILLGAAVDGLAIAAVDLVTVPRREGVQLTIYNSEDITMVREHRFLTVKRGRNRIQFSWAGTLIDPTSIDFRILDHVDQVQLLDTTFPAGRNDALQWNIQSKIDGKLPVEIRYFTSGVTWQADYVGIANEDETELNLTGYVRVTNNSGEVYDRAETRLVVGTISLVEKIADLARRPAPGESHGGWAEDGGFSFGDRDKSKEEEERARRSGVYRRLDMSEVTRDRASAEQAQGVQKQGLSEYFLFAIDGRTDISDSTPIRLVALSADHVPLECVYKASDRDGSGMVLTKFYRFKNEKLTADDGTELQLPDMENLGLSPLPDGNVRLFFQYPTRDLAYVGGTQTKYVPIGDRVEVNVGPEPSITLRRVLKDRRISGVVARQYRERTSRTMVRYYDLIDYDETLVYEEEIVSGKPTDAMIEVERRFDADVYLWGSEGKPEGWDGNEPGAYVDMHGIDGRIERVDQNHVKYFVDLEPGERRIIRYTVTYKRRRVGPRLNVEDRREPITTDEEPEKPVDETPPQPEPRPDPFAE